MLYLFPKNVGVQFSCTPTFILEPAKQKLLQPLIYAQKSDTKIEKEAFCAKTGGKKLKPGPKNRLNVERYSVFVAIKPSVFRTTVGRCGFAESCCGVY